MEKNFVYMVVVDSNDWSGQREEITLYSNINVAQDVFNNTVTGFKEETKDWNNNLIYNWEENDNSTDGDVVCSFEWWVDGDYVENHFSVIVYKKEVL